MNHLLAYLLEQHGAQSLPEILEKLETIVPKARAMEHGKASAKVVCDSFYFDFKEREVFLCVKLPNDVQWVFELHSPSRHMPEGARRSLHVLEAGRRNAE